MKVTVPLIELLKIKEHREAALSLFSNISDSNTVLPTGSYKNGKDQEFQTPEVYVGTTITQEPSQVDPFYVTLLVNNRLIKNCMIDSGAVPNVMPYGVMKELGLLVTTVYGKCYAMDNREVPVIGTMKDVEVKIAAFPKATYKMDVIVTDTKPHYGMLLTRQWAVAVGRNDQLDLSYATIPINGNQVQLYKEPRAPRVIENVDPSMLNCMIDVDLDNFRIQPILSQLKNTNSIVIELESQQHSLWQMYFDGACSKEGSGVGVPFVSPSGITFKYSFLLAFQCTNNTAEYEALLLGLEVAKRHGIQLLKVLGDS